MADLAKQIAEAKSQGYSDDDIIGYLGTSHPELAPKIKEATASGYKASDILGHLAPAQQGFFSRATSAFLESSGGKALWDMLQGAQRNGDPAVHQRAVDTAKNLVFGIADEPHRVWSELNQAGNAFMRGDFSGGLRHTAGSVPIIGAGALQVAKDADEGDWANAFGHSLGMVAPFAAPAMARTAGAAKDATAAAASRAVKIKSTLNPVQQDAVNFLREKNVPLDVGTQTGNKYVKALQATTANSPLGAQQAAEFSRGTETGIQRVAGELTDQAYRAPATPESAGRAVPATLQRKIADMGLETDQAYKDAWVGRNDPQHTYNVPVKTVRTALPNGEIGEKTVTKRVNMPVDVRDIKAQAKPIFDEMQWMPAAEKSASAGYQAVKTILEGDDFIPAWQAEKGLGGLKSMARLANKSGVRDAGQGIAAGIIPDLQQQIDAAVASTGDDALQALRRGREVHAQKMGVADLAEKLREEPVQAFQQLTWQHDTGIDLLRQIQEHAPDQMPMVGRAFVQQLIEKATREGGFTKTRGILDRWNDLGPETKKILFPDAELRANIGKFLKGADMVAQNPNPSGTALVQAANSVNPLRWAAGMVGSKLFFTPKGIALLTDGLKSPGAAAFAEGKFRTMGGPAPVTPIEPTLPGGIARPRTSTEPVSFPARKGEIGDILAKGVRDDGTAAGDAGAITQGQADYVETPARPAFGAPETANEIRIPGAGNRRYKAFYQVRELADVQPSHSGHTFQPNERYQITNDRDYSRAENQGKIVDWSGPEFDPSYHITDNPDASNGPPVIDEVGNVYGGNGRTMILQRVYKSNPTGAAAYRQMLTKKAAQFGIDPEQVKGMKEPVLVRVIPDEEMAGGGSARQRAVTDFNKTGTAALRGSEKAIADSRRVSVETLENITARLEEEGHEATLSNILDGRGGPEVLNRLITDGVISKQESAAYVDSGALTAEGKSRISKLMLGRFFRDPAQLDRTPPSIRGKLERIAAPLAKVETKREWSLAEPIQEAIDLIEDARGRGQKNLDDVVSQSDLFGSQQYSPAGIRLAKLLRDANPNELTKAFRQYASDASEAGKGQGLFGEPPTPQEAFDAAFSSLLKK